MNPMDRFASLPPLCVMIVDDAPVIRQTVQLFLSNGGHRVLLADGALTALEQLEKEIPDLIVIDQTLEPFDGYDLCLRLKAVPPTPWLPVVLLLPKDSPLDVERAHACGIDGHFHKPFTKDALLAAVASAWTARERHVLRAAADHEAHPSPASAGRGRTRL